MVVKTVVKCILSHSINNWQVTLDHCRTFCSMCIGIIVLSAYANELSIKHNLQKLLIGLVAE